MSHTLAKIQSEVTAFVGALIGGVGLFAMTIWLVLKGGPHPGQHLSLLSIYFVGYSVTWEGALVGVVYGALAGGLVGWVIGRLYNVVLLMRQR